MVGTPVIIMGSQEKVAGWWGVVPGMRAGREEESKTKLKYASGSQI